MRAKPLAMQRRAERAMRDAMYLGVDPRNANAVSGLCYENPFVVPLIKRKLQRIAVLRRRRLYD